MDAKAPKNRLLRVAAGADRPAATIRSEIDACSGKPYWHKLSLCDSSGACRLGQADCPCSRQRLAAKWYDSRNASEMTTTTTKESVCPILQSRSQSQSHLVLTSVTVALAYRCEAVQPSLGITAPIHPVGLVQRHLRRPIEGIVHSFHTKHELSPSAAASSKCDRVDSPNDPGSRTRISNSRIVLVSESQNRVSAWVGSVQAQRLSQEKESG